jgi:hypothetical protein
MRNYGGVGRGCGVGRGLGVTLSAGVADGVGVGVSVAVGLGGAWSRCRCRCRNELPGIVEISVVSLAKAQSNAEYFTLMSGRGTRCKCDRNGAADKNSGCARKVSNLSEFHRA